MDESRRVWLAGWKNLLDRDFEDVRVLGGWQRYEALVPLFDAWLREVEESEGGETPALTAALDRVGVAHTKHDRFGPAEARLGRCLEIDERLHGPEHPVTLT